MRNKLNPKRLRASLISFAAIVLVIFGRLFFLSITEQGVSTRKVLPEFNNLFTRETQSKLNIPVNYESKYESLSSNYYYNNKYYLSVRSFFVPKNTSIESLISVKNRNPFLTGGTFSDSNSDFLEMGFKLEKTDSIRKIDLYLDGDSITTVAKNDRMICYYLKAKSFYMYYNGTNSPNIKAEAKHDNTPVSIAFLKKNNKIYLLMMDIKEAETMRPDLLYSLINK